jgi:ribosomal protein S17
MKEEYGDIGLTINKDKCYSTENGGRIEFMGQEFEQERSVSIAAKLLNKIGHTINIIETAPITKHEKFLFLSLVAVS